MHMLELLFLRLHSLPTSVAGLYAAHKNTIYTRT